MLHINDLPDIALHEYTHHMQATMPGLDAHFQALHRRCKRARRLDYVDSYFGKEYPMLGAEFAPNGPALEVITRAMQTTFYPLHGRKEFLPDLVRYDPEMLDLTLGLLLRYDP